MIEENQAATLAKDLAETLKPGKTGIEGTYALLIFVEA